MNNIPQYTLGDNRASHSKNLILKLVRSGRLKKGEQLPPQSELAERLGVSRTALREALTELSYRGIISSRQGKGTFVSGEIMEAEATMEVRKVLEPKMAAFAAERRSAEDLEKLADLYAVMARHTENNEPAEFYVADLDFHAAIADMTYNPAMPLLFSTIKDILFYRQNLSKLPPVTMRKANAFHAEIIFAIREKNAASAERIMIEHIDDVIESLD